MEVIIMKEEEIREELKAKINEHIDSLSLEDLERISGGNCSELSEDSIVLRSLGLCNGYSYFDLLLNPGHCQAIVGAWDKAGVQCKFSDLFVNEYYINGKKVSRNEAVAFVKNKAK
jgi:hypothetical protein